MSLEVSKSSIVKVDSFRFTSKLRFREKDNHDSPNNLMPRVSYSAIVNENDKSLEKWLLRHGIRLEEVQEKMSVKIDGNMANSILTFEYEELDEILCNIAKLEFSFNSHKSISEYLKHTLDWEKENVDNLISSKDFPDRDENNRVLAGGSEQVWLEKLVIKCNEDLLNRFSKLYSGCDDKIKKALSDKFVESLEANKGPDVATIGKVTVKILLATLKVIPIIGKFADKKFLKELADIGKLTFELVEGYGKIKKKYTEKPYTSLALLSDAYSKLSKCMGTDYGNASINHHPVYYLVNTSYRSLSDILRFIDIDENFSKQDRIRLKEKVLFLFCLSTIETTIYEDSEFVQEALVVNTIIATSGERGFEMDTLRLFGRTTTIDTWAFAGGEYFTYHKMYHRTGLYSRTETIFNRKEADRNIFKEVNQFLTNELKEAAVVGVYFDIEGCSIPPGKMVFSNQKCFALITPLFSDAKNTQDFKKFKKSKALKDGLITKCILYLEGDIENGGRISSLVQLENGEFELTTHHIVTDIEYDPNSEKAYGLSPYEMPYHRLNSSPVRLNSPPVAEARKIPKTDKGTSSLKIKELPKTYKGASSLKIKIKELPKTYEDALSLKIKEHFKERQNSKKLPENFLDIDFQYDASYVTTGRGVNDLKNRNREGDLKNRNFENYYDFGTSQESPYPKLGAESASPPPNEEEFLTANSPLPLDIIVGSIKLSDSDKKIAKDVQIALARKMLKKNLVSSEDNSHFSSYFHQN